MSIDLTRKKKISLILKYTTVDVVRKKFVIKNYYRKEMIKDKDIKIQINKYHKLLEDIKAETILLRQI